ncbi:MAG TPA: carboxypeptidase-like regulatory domain-containing protein [Bryobacteraceae bacterium]|nr:carboxypeptidase-like regulatory domain-containing protein [Bryobacteraceae bacterium]
MRCIRKSLAIFAFAALPLAAQTGLGIVRGTVQDASKAVIPNAKVTLTNTATGVARESQTNAAGIYYFGAIPIGPYSLDVEAEGFKKWQGTMDVQVGQTVVVDPTMEVGSLQSAVEVTGAAPTIDTQGSQVADVKDALRIHDLPLNGRQISQLFDLTPGVVGGGNPRTNGMKVGATEMNFDGMSMVDRFGGGISRMQPGLDTVQEFRIETAGSGAQYSRPATIDVASRSGTNEFHGALFETFRDNAAGLRARQRQDGNTPAKYIRNEYGGYAGGPVLVPGLYNGKNKTFWLFDWEGMKQRQNRFAITGVPTASMWQGDLSNITDFNGDQFTLYDPKTTSGPNGVRQPFPGNKIPQNYISQYAAIFQSVTPIPNIAGNLNPWVNQNFQYYYPVPNNQHTWTIKIDHNFSEKDMISGRISLAPNFNATYGGKYGYPPPGCTNCGGSGEQDIKFYSENIHWNHVFKPTLMNELQLSGFRTATHYGTLGDSTNWANKLGLPNPFGVTGWPTIYFSGYYDPASNMLYYGGWDGDNNHRQNLTSFQIDDGVTWVKGKHSIKAGIKLRQEYNNVEELQQAEGSHSFYADWTQLYDPSAQGPVAFTGTGFADMLMGLPTYLSNQYNRGFFYFQQKEIDGYINDTWKVSPRLTVDVGLRWDHWNPYHEKYNRLVNLDPLNYPGFTVVTPHNTTIESLPNIPSGVLDSWKTRGLSWVTADTVSGFPKALIPQYFSDFGPRLAVAYRITDKWVVRGGYGMYYWPMPLAQILQASRSNPPLNLRFENTVADHNGTIPNYDLLNAPASTDYLPNATVNVYGIQPIPSTSRSFFGFDPHHWSDDRMQQWTFNVERELMRNTSLRVSYIGTHGSNLEQLTAWNNPESAYNYEVRTGLEVLPGGSGADARRPNPNWNGRFESHIGYSNSHSIQAQVERTFASGLTFQFSYTYDHALTTSDAGGFSDGADGAILPLTTGILGEPNLSTSQRLKLIYYNSGSVPPHQIKWNGVYELPFGKGKKFASNVSGLVNQIVGGWQIAFIGNWRSGFWTGVNGNDYLFGNPALSSGQRLKMYIFGHEQELYFRGDFDPTQATGVDASKLEALVPVDRSQRVMHPLGSSFNNRLPLTLANGQVVHTSYDVLSWNAHNFFLGPRSWNEDLSAFKYFDLKERWKVRFSADFFNAFNHPNDLNPNSTTGLINLSQQANDPRIIQFSARMEW